MQIAAVHALNSGPEPFYVDDISVYPSSWFARDCNGNLILDDCDILEGTSADVNSDEVPDECELSPPLAAPAPYDVPKNRYISFVPNNGDASVSFQVELSASDYFPGSTGVVGWVGQPFAAEGQADTWLAHVVDAPPAPRVWNEPVVHVAGCPIVSAATYGISGVLDEVVFSSPVQVSTVAKPGTKYWADCVGEWNGSEWTAPNEVVNMDDVMAAVQKFQQLPAAPHLTWVDIDPEEANAVLNFTDILRIVQGFKGEAYPFSDPADCP